MPQTSYTYFNRSVTLAGAAPQTVNPLASVTRFRNDDGTGAQLLVTQDFGSRPIADLPRGDAGGLVGEEIVDRYLDGRRRVWAVVAAFGDNLATAARNAAAPLGLAAKVSPSKSSAPAATTP